jgi:RNA polymerase sigma factor (sigma-70 family)
MNDHPASADEYRPLLERHRDALWRLTAGYARQQADREDLYQDILLAVWSALPRFRGDCSERTFVYRIAHNRGITHRTRAQRAWGPSLDDLPPPADRRNSPELEIIERDRAGALREAVRQLPLAYREIVMLRLEGLSSRDIAEVAGITENNVDVRLTRARQRLRDLFREGDTG